MVLEKSQSAPSDTHSVPILSDELLTSSSHDANPIVKNNVEHKGVEPLHFAREVKNFKSKQGKKGHRNRVIKHPNEDSLPHDRTITTTSY